MEKYRIDWSPVERTITVRMAGFWNAEDVTSYNRDLIAAARKAGDSPFDIVADMTDLLAQSQEAVTNHTPIV